MSFDILAGCGFVKLLYGHGYIMFIGYMAILTSESDLWESLQANEKKLPPSHSVVGYEDSWK